MISYFENKEKHLFYIRNKIREIGHKLNAAKEENILNMHNKTKYIKRIILEQRIGDKNKHLKHFYTACLKS